MLWEFKNNKNATETAKKNCNVYGQGVITDCQVQIYFSRFRCRNTSLRNEPRPGHSLNLDQDALRELEESRPQHIPINNLPPLDKKSEPAMRLASP